MPIVILLGKGDIEWICSKIGGNGIGLCPNRSRGNGKLLDSVYKFDQFVPVQPERITFKSSNV